MRKIFDPVSGEEGYFCSEQEKVLIDAIVTDYSRNHLIPDSSSRSARGVEYD